METFVFFLLVVVGLAIFGAVAEAFGADSRELIGDSHLRDVIRRTI